MTTLWHHPELKWGKKTVRNRVFRKVWNLSSLLTTDYFTAKIWLCSIWASTTVTAHMWQKIRKHYGWILTWNYNQASFYYHCFEPVTIQNCGFDYNIEGDEFFPLASTFQKNLCYTGASPQQTQTRTGLSLRQEGRRKTPSQTREGEGANTHTPQLEMSALMSNKTGN